MMKFVMRRKHWLRDEVGPVGLSAIVLLAAALLLLQLLVRPLEQRNDELRADVERAEAQAVSPERALRDASPAAQLAAFYQHLTTTDQPADWLAKLNSLAGAAGLRLGAGDYRLQRTPGARLERYEVTLPLSGSYAEIRSFLENALAQLPLMSVDRVTFRRESANDARVDAEARLTFHWARP